MKTVFTFIWILFAFQINAQSIEGEVSLSPNTVALGDILKSIMPSMTFNTEGGASIKPTVSEDNVINSIISLIGQGVRIDSLRIIGFKDASELDLGGGITSVSSGEFGKLISIKDGKNGITLIQYCEAIKCLKIAKVFMNEIARINNSTLIKNKELNDLKQKAEKGDIKSQIELGVKFRDGIIPLEKDVLGAMNWFKMAAEKNDPTALFNLAEIYLIEKSVKDYDKAFSLYLKSADQGNPSAQNRVGLCYFKSIGTQGDKSLAIKYWTKAAEAGNVYAQSSLGACFENGNGTPQDFKEALKWYKMAADQGYDIAQGSLGIMYFKGKGVPQNYVEAEKWLNKAAGQGNVACQRNLEYLRTLMGK